MQSRSRLRVIDLARRRRSISSRALERGQLAASWPPHQLGQTQKSCSLARHASKFQQNFNDQDEKKGEHSWTRSECASNFVCHSKRAPSWPIFLFLLLQNKEHNRADLTWLGRRKSDAKLTKSQQQQQLSIGARKSLVCLALSPQQFAASSNKCSAVLKGK